MSGVRAGKFGWASALAGWTVFVWINRVRNVFADDDLTGFGLAWRLAVAVWFVTVAGLIVVGLLLGRTRPAHRVGAQWATKILAVAGSAWWSIRGGQILLGDWDVSFKVVHSVLALVTIGLSVMALLALGSAPLWVNQSVSSRSRRPTTE